MSGSRTASALIFLCLISYRISFLKEMNLSLPQIPKKLTSLWKSSLCTFKIEESGKRIRKATAALFGRG